jgi:hypothetical protein
MLTAEEQTRLSELEKQVSSQSNLSQEEQARLTELEGKFSPQAITKRLSPQEDRRLNELEGKERYSAFQAVQGAIGDFISGGVKQFKRITEIYEEERLSGRKAIETAYQYPSWGNIGRGALGVAQYTFSPVTALGKGAVKEPITENLERTPLKDVQVPLGQGNAAQFLGNIAEQGFYFTPVGQMTKARMVLNQPSGIRAAMDRMPVAGQGVVAKATKTIPDEVPIPETRPELPTALKQTLEGDGIALKPRLESKIVRDVTNASFDYLKGNPDESKRIFKRIADGLSVGEINPEMLPEIIQKYGITPVQFASMYKDTVSFGGRILGYHGYAAKQLQQVFKDEPEALSLLQSAIKAESQAPMLTDRIIDAWSRVENARRGLLVTQVATAMRNIVSQTGRLALSSVDEAFQGVLRGTVGYKGNTLAEAENGLNNLTAIWNRLSPSGRGRLDEILESESVAVEKARLLSQPVHEAIGGKMIDAFNYLNRTQETFFRKIAFEAKLREKLSRKGLDYSTIDPKHIPEDFLREATDYSLEMTFSASPKSNAAKQFVNAWNKTGLTTINPFPRFAFANALPFVLEHSPLGYLNAMRPEIIKELASGNPERFVKAASRATLGTLMLDSAWRIRQSQYAGEKWYEIKTGYDPKTKEEKVIDARAFAPFSAYLLMAEAFIHPERLNVEDYAQALIGMNRIAGTGLVAVDLLRAKSGETAKDVVNKFVGSYLGSFSVPARTVKDLYSGIDPEEGVYRDVKKDPIAGPFLQNIPEISQMFPESPSPYTTKRQGKASEENAVMGIPAPVFRQISGFYQNLKPEVKQEVDKIGLDYTRIYPRTGVADADRKIIEYMAPIIERYGSSLIQSKQYQSLTNPGRRLAMGQLFTEARAEARRVLNKNNPELSLRIAWEGQSDDVKALMEERGLSVK